MFKKALKKIKNTLSPEDESTMGHLVHNQEDRQKWTQLANHRRQLSAGKASTLRKVKRAYRKAGCAPEYKKGQVVAYLYNLDLVKERFVPENHQPGVDPHYVRGVV